MATTHAALLARRPSRRRRVVDKTMRSITMIASGVALVPLLFVIYYLVSKGLPAWNVDFFTTDPTGSFLGDPGGIKSVIVGSIVIVAIATITIEPTIALLMPPGSPRKLPVGSVVKKSTFQAGRPLETR